MFASTVTAAPAPSERHFRVLGLPPGSAVASCVEAFERRERFYDPRHHREHQSWAIGHTDDLDEALALIVDAERWEGAGR